MALTPNDMTDAIEAAYEKEWAKAKPNPLPAMGKDNRRLLFAGIARGILEYLAGKQTEFLTSIKAKDPAGVQTTYQVLETDFNIDAH